MALQKIFLLPPLKGLNLYDNPFTMSPDFAVELVNFMPPTTTFSVRPGVEQILTLDGQVRGIYSYTTGVTEDYGANWYNSTIKYGAARLLLIKSLKSDGQTYLLGADPQAFSVVPIRTVGNAYYNDDSALYKHTMFFTSGSPDCTMYLYHESKGLVNFSLRLGDDASKSPDEVGDMQNITIFKDWIFLSGNNSLNVYFIEAKNADILDPATSDWWREANNLFSPLHGKMFSLDGVVQNGGSIIKLINISRSGSDTVNTYLSAITDQGEIVLFDGVDPSDPTGEKWKVVGHFQIPPPLNRWAFVDMEGDLIVATKNGLVSLRRVMFGQSSQITDNLEFRLLSLFSQYMFKMPSFSEFIGLYYHPRNRLLIFNVPIDMPMPFNKIVTTYNFNGNKQIVFPQITDENGKLSPTIPQTTIDKLTAFINSYVVTSYISYTLTIEINADKASNKIYIDIAGTANGTKGTITVTFGAMRDNVATDFLNNKIIYTVDNLNSASRVAYLASIPQDGFQWNSSLYTQAPNQSLNNIYKYIFGDPTDVDKDYIVTNIIPENTIFYVPPSEVVTLGNLTPPENIEQYKGINPTGNIMVGLYPDDSTRILSCENFFMSDELGVTDFYSQDHQVDKIGFNDDPLKISPFKAVVKAFSTIFWSGSNLGASSADLTFKTQCTLTNKLSNDETTTFVITFNVNWISKGNNYAELNGSLDVTSVASDPKDIIGYHVDYTGDHGSYSITQNIGYVEITPDDYTVHWAIGFEYDGSAPIGPDIFYYNLDKIIPFSGDHTLFEYDGYTSWTVNSSSADDVTKNIIVALKDLMPETTGETVWNESYGYFMSNFVLKGPNQNLNLKSHEDEPKSHITNVDLTAIPLFNNIDIACNFRSTQYVFDSHFGTWSQFEDVNMIKGIEHNNDFYFIVPNDIQYNSGSDRYFYTKSSLCRFNPDQLGDNKLSNEDSLPSQPRADNIPIRVSYKTVPTFDFGAPTKKFLKRIRIFGTPSTFWQGRLSTQEPYPMIITPYMDFKKGQPVSFIHAFDHDSTSLKILRNHFLGKKMHELTFSEQKKFWQLYESENDMITQISMPLIANPGSRFGLEMSMEMREAYVDIYGFEIFFEVSPQNL
jgi:hypothetical protein